ncbi:hypothetical protein [Nonomuraea typhae]|uniref:hypothetical protein n=1 Tax=Nonomuraea typhae TaxID=2603600 RepID=UPI0012F7F9B3|nr:hypothetical protein [Nonomuraea typhae]
MTARQCIQWITLPGGYLPDGSLRASVFVAPRLEADGPATLAAFPDFLDWPASLTGAVFRADVDDPAAPFEGVRPVGPPPDPALWRALFGPHTPVRSYVFDDYRGHEVRTYPAKDVSSAVRGGYARAAADSPEEMPTEHTVTLGDEAGARFGAFHERPEDTAGLDGPEAFRENVDFHQMISALGDHPLLLRRLGLVFDVSIPAAHVPVNDLHQTIRVLPAWQSLLPAGQSRDVCAHTWYVHRPGLFAAVGRGASMLGSLTGGLIALPEEQFSVEQADIDGTVQKALTMDPADSSGFPALRTSGFSVVRDKRAAYLVDDFALAASREADLAAFRAIDLHADDLVRGHRLDVWDERAGRWYSLHERTLDYTVPGDPANSVTGVRAEGFFQVSLAGAGAGGLYVHERLISWDGWSLSAPRPGKVLSEDPRAPAPGAPETQPKHVPNTACTALPLEIESAVLPGSLPRLRFGRRYRFRIRTVDLAGNGPTLEDAPDLGPGYALPGDGPAVFRRFEPVPAPTLVPRVPFTEGASTHRLVIRSTPGQSAGEYAAAFNAAPPAGHPPYAAADERHLVAPKAALQLAEWHGMLDAAIGSADPAIRREVYELARREKGRLDDPGLPGAQTAGTTGPAGTPGLPGAGPGGQGVVLHTGEQVAVPYLPDPLALGAVFHGLPGAGGRAFVIRWDGVSWDRPRSFRLVLAEGRGAPRWDEAARVLTVEAPPGLVATVRVGSLVEAGPELLGVLGWCEEELDAQEYAVVARAAAAGRHWMITPWHEVTLVHAVQRPLLEPELSVRAEVNRGPGDTFAHLSGRARLSVATTEQIDLVASWTETIDDLAFDGPRERACSARVFRLPVASGEESGVAFDTRSGEVARQEFGDTRFRAVHYHAVAGSAFREYFPPEFADQLSVRGPAVLDEVLSSARPLAPKVLYGVPTQRWETREDERTVTRIRHGGGVRIYLDRPWFSSGAGELLGVLGHRSGNPQPYEDVYQHVTLIGRDPIYESESLHPLGLDSFPNAVARAEELRLPQGFDVWVAGHRPEYDPATRRWFCDIDLDTGLAYFPFVRLALARYQPRSIGGMHLSEVVQADILRTLPTRTLSVTKGSPLGVSLTGPAYVAPEGARVAARLDRRDPAVADEVLGWKPVAGTMVTLRPEFTEEGNILGFLGQVPVPPARPGERRRLTVTEYERLPSDGDTSERVVYCDTVDL